MNKIDIFVSDLTLFFQNFSNFDEKKEFFFEKSMEGWNQEKPYHTIFVYGLSKIYFQQYHVCIFVRYITNILY